MIGKLLNPQDLLRRLEEKAAEVREFQGTGTSRVFSEFLELLELSYFADLRALKPEGLAATQARLDQCEQLRKLLAGERTNARG
jgi:hypothetical protein